MTPVVQLGAPSALGTLLDDPGTAVVLLALLWLLVMVAGDALERLLRRRRGEPATDRDPLTGLPGRSALARDTRRLPRLRLRRGRHVVVCVVDLDGFKEVNDSLGHGVGDQLLVAVARRLDAVVADRGQAYRVGGDEFLTLVTCTSRDDEETFLDTLRAGVNTVVELDDLPVPVAASVGSAATPRDGSSFPDLLEAADAALYRRKHAAVETRATKRAAHRADTAQLRGQVADALAAGDITVHYQPQVHASLPTITGFEAFLRWEHPTYGVLTAAEFTDAVHQSGHAADLDDLVWDRVLADHATLTRVAPGAGISVNVSARTLLGRTFTATLRDKLAAHDVAARAVTLEVDQAAARLHRDGSGVLHDVAALGCSVSVPGLGGPRTSLTAVWGHEAVRQLKVHPDVATGLRDNRRARRTVRAMVCAAHSLDATVVAEGVETREVAELFRTLGCDALQGRWVGSPMNLTEVCEWAARHHHRDPD